MATLVYTSGFRSEEEAKAALRAYQGNGECKASQVWVESYQAAKGRGERWRICVAGFLMGEPQLRELSHMEGHLRGPALARWIASNTVVWNLEAEVNPDLV